MFMIIKSLQLKEEKATLILARLKAPLSKDVSCARHEACPLSLSPFNAKMSKTLSSFYFSFSILPMSRCVLSYLSVMESAAI